MTEKTIISTAAAPAAIGPYSQAVKAGNTVYLSGQIPLDPDTMELVLDSFEDQAMRVIDQISFAVMGANRATLFPDPESPTYTENVSYQVSLGVEDGEVVWGDTERIEMAAATSQVVWRSNPGEPEELRVVWCNLVRPFLEGELNNGIDDNGNGLIDESGLNFTLQGNTVLIRLTLERTDANGKPVEQSVETRVTLRN